MKRTQAGEVDGGSHGGIERRDYSTEKVHYSPALSGDDIRVLGYKTDKWLGFPTCIEEEILDWKKLGLQSKRVFSVRVNARGVYVKILGGQRKTEWGNVDENVWKLMERIYHEEMAKRVTMDPLPEE